jgi:rubrerythrin
VILLSNEEKVKFYKKQIELEKKIVQAAEESVEDMENKIVKELILAIAIDSKKHASLLGVLTTMNTSSVPYISEKSLDKIAKNIKKHIELEAQAIETYKELLTKIDTDQEKMIVQTIYHDELRHHALLERLYEIIIKNEAITEEDLWDYLKDDYIPQY